MPVATEVSNLGGTLVPCQEALISQQVIREEFADEVRAGLSKSQKELPAKHLYDQVGSALFEVITVLPEYGLTRAEERLLLSHATEITRWLPPRVAVVELGSGSGRKTKPVLQAIVNRQECVNYCAIDISPTALEACRGQLSGLPGVRVQSMQEPYLEGLSELCERRAVPLLVLFLGSTIGNFGPAEAVRFLTGVRACLRPGDAFLLGVDLIKPTNTLLAAYDDPAGVTAAFNLNLLARINRELNGNFNLRNFRHEARWNASDSRIEMHLRSLGLQIVDIPGARSRVAFDHGETIWTESSHKFETGQLSRLAEQAGFIDCARWIDREWPFAECLWMV
jgi:dimethylhistidine N-methyltransferase